MENILKLIVKKDIFDKLASGKQDYVYVESNNYWIKRLAVNSVDSFQKLKETQAFKTFDCVSVTCGKENAQYQFKTIKTGHENMEKDGWDTGFCIWIAGNEEVEAEKSDTVSNGEPIDEPVNENVNVELHKASMEESIEDYVEIDSNETESENVKAEVSDTVSNNEPIDEPVNEPVNSEDNEEPKEVLVEDETEPVSGLPDAENTKENLKSSIDFLIDVIGGYDNVIIVNRPNIIITSNGRIFGTKDRLDINNDEEIRVNVGTEKLYDDTNNDKDFLKKIENYLMDYTKSGCIFIYKEGCDVVYTEEGRYLKMKMTKKMYLNR